MDRTIAINKFPEISLFNVQHEANCVLDLIDAKDEVYTYKFSVNYDVPTAPQAITLRWKMPFLNMGGIWKCGEVQNKRQQYDWELDHLKTRISVDAPVIAVMGLDDLNAITFACSDAINPIELNALLREEDNHLYCHITFFSEQTAPLENYEAEIRIDLRKIPFFQTLPDVAKWWETFEHLKPAFVPELAREPLYSTWYQFHQNLDEDILVTECEIAASMGYKLIILDDGWQTMDDNRGYDYTGDWEAVRFSDMKSFVSRVQDTGMKVGLWFSVPFCGKYSKAYQRFKGKFLTENHRWAPVFDPRYPEVRAYLIEKYTNAIKDWNLDALKLDFIDDFRAYPETVLTKADGRDYASVDAGVDRLLSDVMLTLKQIKPDIAIEFRQKYIGPTMRKFGNMFRAFDCPNDPISNRIRVTDVKLLCGDSAVHSDPQTWHIEEKVEVAALQVINGIFGVPQMSVHLRNLPEDQLKMLRFYTNYWSSHKHILLDGQFQAYRPSANYPLLKAKTDTHKIIGVYEDIVVEVAHFEVLDVLNGKLSNHLVIRNISDAKQIRLRIWDCCGTIEYDEQILLASGLTELEIKPAGMARLEMI